MNAAIEITTLNPSPQAAGRARKVFLPPFKAAGRVRKTFLPSFKPQEGLEKCFYHHSRLREGLEKCFYPLSNRNGGLEKRFYPHASLIERLEKLFHLQHRSSHDQTHNPSSLIRGIAIHGSFFTALHYYRQRHILHGYPKRLNGGNG
jgi:hypothetical protein